MLSRKEEENHYNTSLTTNTAINNNNNNTIKHSDTFFDGSNYSTMKGRNNCIPPETGNSLW